MSSPLGIYGSLFYWGLIQDALQYYGIHHSPSKILKLYKNKSLGEPWKADFRIWHKRLKIFGLHDHAFDKKRIFLFMEGDNNYSISTTIFGYNPKLSL